MIVNGRKRSCYEDSTGLHSIEKKLKSVFGSGATMECSPACVVIDEMEVSSPNDRSYDGIFSNAVMESKTFTPQCMDLCVDDPRIDGAPSQPTRHKGRTIGDYCSKNSLRKDVGAEMKTGEHCCQGCQFDSEDVDMIVNCDFCDRRFCNRRCIAMCCSCGGRYCVYTCSTLDYSTLFVQPLCLDCKRHLT